MAEKDKGLITTGAEQKVLPAFLGGDSTIEAVVGRSGKVESYNVSFYRSEGTPPVVFSISKEQGDDLISARLAKLTSEVLEKEIVDDEVFQSLVPAYVADEYRKKLIEMGVPENEIPTETQDIIKRIKQDLITYRELGREQIALEAQQVADELLSIAHEVLKGDNFRYNNLPKAFKQQVDFHLPSLGALASQNAGITEETMEAQRRVLKMNLMAQEETRNMLLDHFKTTVGAGGEALGMFFGQMFGGAKGAAEVAYRNTKEALSKKK